MSNDLLSNDPAAKIYSGQLGKKYHEQKRHLHPTALPWVMELRAKKFQPHVRASDLVFEMGVGSGWNLGRLNCAKRLGCDAADFLEKDVKALDITFFRNIKDVPTAIADVAICHQTLEHLLHPAATLTELLRILKPSGQLILHVPWERERRYARYRPEEPNHHLYNWNAQNIGNLVEVLGYRIKSVCVLRYGYDRFAANLAVRLHGGEAAFRIIRTLMIAARPLREIELIAAREKRNVSPIST